MPERYESGGALAYLSVILVNAATLALSAAAEPILEPYFYALFLASVGLCAWRWGLGPSILSALLAASSVLYVFLPPHYSLTIGDWTVFTRLSVFTLSSLCVAWMVCELARARFLLRLGEDRLRMAVTSCPMMVFNQDRWLQYTWAAGAADLVAEPVLGKTDDEVLGPEAAKALRMLKDTVFAHERAVHERIGVKVGGRERTLDVVMEPARGRHGEIIGILGSAVDVSDSVTAEERVYAVQKIETIGMLARAVARELNDILVVTIGSLRQVSARLCAQDLSHRVQAAVRSAESAMKLIQQLSSYTDGDDRVGRVNLSQIVRDQVELLRISAAAGTACELELSDDLPTICAYPEHLHQLVARLFLNAEKAIGKHAGRIAISTGITVLQEHDLKAAQTAPGSQPGRFVYLDVAAAATRVNFSWSEAVDGTISSSCPGSSLWAIGSIVRRYQGVIQMRRMPDAGVAIRVLFPASSQSEPAVQSN